MTIDLLPSVLRGVLPPLGAQRDAINPVVYAHLFIPDTPWHYYITEGAVRSGTYRCFGFLLASDDDKNWQWTETGLSDLEGLVGIQRNDAFISGRFDDAVPYPFPDG